MYPEHGVTGGLCDIIRVRCPAPDAAALAKLTSDSSVACLTKPHLDPFGSNWHYLQSRASSDSSARNDMGIGPLDLGLLDSQMSTCFGS